MQTKKVLVAAGVGLFAASILTPAVAQADHKAEHKGKVTICHQTSAENSRWIVIKISENAWKMEGEPGHQTNHKHLNRWTDGLNDDDVEGEFIKGETDPATVCPKDESDEPR